MEQVELTRDCNAVEIPAGTPVVLEKGTEVMITQALGGTFTLRVPAYGGLFRIAGTDARIRVSSLMLPVSSWGTLRSARMNTRLPRKSRSVIRRIVMVSGQYRSATNNTEGTEKKGP